MRYRVSRVGLTLWAIGVALLILALILATMALREERVVKNYTATFYSGEPSLLRELLRVEGGCIESMLLQLIANCDEDLTLVVVDAKGNSRVYVLAPNTPLSLENVSLLSTLYVEGPSNCTVNIMLRVVYVYYPFKELSLSSLGLFIAGTLVLGLGVIVLWLGIG